ncbi:Phosphoglycolate phosphatase [Planktothrix tepida]|uniref:HAD-superfamily hydrolase, subfamily IIB n=2 Tax=Planktothrix TaxID=54304 RepID=A0A1J1LJD0_9CYAN|nr:MULTISPECIES: HAD family hydrolase [Planktothrix]CAD5951075.1 Phosphoglycolate phosphatase [Planktothrix tepida]CAD5959651.1 Phosphoglycolate phosphatase [Planktothrix pseudagardhii]CUR32607.1 HAD-superfamily hydrolase, subfamily IIB [Planktothrix tepida PCC 9214]
MNYLALATDFDGTLATDGMVEESTLNALERWQQSGRKLILITGRQLDNLIAHIPVINVFDWVIAENGAVLYQPPTKLEKLLAERPSEDFISLLRDRIDQKQQSLKNQAVPEEFSQIAQAQLFEALGVGRVIIATWEPYLEITQKTIQELGVNLQIICNKGAVMVLPEGINKAFGLNALSQLINLPLQQIVGVGDAENDCDFLEQCGYSVAVANALPQVKEKVNWVTKNSRGAGVIELINHLL